jgi:hypothetical protein
VAQWLVATRLAYHAGNGNPEMIGQSLSVFQGQGFRRVEEWHSEWSASEFEDFLNDLYREQVLGQSKMLRENATWIARHHRPGTKSRSGLSPERLFG